MSVLCRSYSDVVLSATKGRDYDITVREPGGDVTLVALHGGTLAPPTAELATAIASADHNLYVFAGLREGDTEALCISPLRAREPRLDNLVRRSRVILSIAGSDKSEAVVWVGGTNAALCTLLQEALSASGYDARPSACPGIDTSSAYFFNRASEGGVELALSAGLRRSMAPAGDGEATEVMTRFVTVVRDTLQRHVAISRVDLERTMERFERDTARIPPEIRTRRGRPERNGDGD